MFFMVNVCWDCNFNCKYCYQHNKQANKVIKVETFKKLLDFVFSDNYDKIFGLKDKRCGNEPYGLFFHGGEVLLHIQEIEQMTELFLNAIKPYSNDLIEKPSIGIVTNGYALSNPKVRAYIEKYADVLDMAYSIDGEQEIHDKNRLTLSGQPTYATAWTNFLNRPRTHIERIKYTITESSIGHLDETLRKFSALDKSLRIDPSYDETVSWETLDKSILGDQLDKIISWYISQDKEWVASRRCFRTPVPDFMPQFMSKFLNTMVCRPMLLTLDIDGEILKCGRCSQLFHAGQNTFSFGNINHPEDIDWSLVIKERYIGEDVLLSNNCKLSAPLFEDSDCYRCPIGNYCNTCPIDNKMKWNEYYDWNKTVCDVRAFFHLLDVFFHNYRYKIKKDLGKEINKKDDDDKIKNLYLPKVWALEFTSEAIYNYIADLTASVGGVVNNIDTKFFTPTQVNTILEHLKTERDKVEVNHE